MENIFGRISDEMPCGRPRGQASTVRGHIQASNGQFHAAAGALACDLLNVEATYTSSRNYKTNSATKEDLPVESFGKPHHPSSLPEGVQFLLYTLPVNEVGDGDGFTAYVDTADLSEAADVPREVHEAFSARAQSRGYQNYQRIDALPSSAIDEAGYKMVIGSNNREILARKFRIRLRGIDAPELKMEYGKESRNELVNLIKGKCVVIYVYGKDQFERYVGDIYCEGVFIQEQMLKRGFAWHFKTYDKRREFGQWEREARDARRGLWLSDNPKKPWEWRTDQRNAEKRDGIQMDNGSFETLPRIIKEKKNPEEKTSLWKKEWESAVAENRRLNDQLRVLKEELQNKKEALKQLGIQMDNGSSESLSRMIKEKKNAQEKDREWKKKWESAVAENRRLNDQLRGLKEELQNKKEAFKQLVKQMAIGVGTSMLIVGIVVLFRGKGKPPTKNNGGSLLFSACKQLLM